MTRANTTSCSLSRRNTPTAISSGLTPHLIIVCLDIDDLDGFQVLSMLKLDDDTKGIPVVTCTMQQDDEATHDESVDPPDDVFSQPAMMQLN